MSKVEFSIPFKIRWRNGGLPVCHGLTLRSVQILFKNSAGTESVNQTPLADKKKTTPCWCILPASTSRMTGLPRLAPTFRAVSMSFGQMNVVPFALLQAYAMIEKPLHGAMIQDFGRLFCSSCRSTAVLWP